MYIGSGLHLRLVGVMAILLVIYMYAYFTWDLSHRDLELRHRRRFLHAASPGQQSREPTGPEQEGKTIRKGLHRLTLVERQTVQASGQWYRHGKPFHQLFIRQVTFAFRAARLAGTAPLLHAQLLRGIFHSDQEQYVSVFLNGSQVSLHLQLGVLHDRNQTQYTVDSDMIIKVGLWYVVCLCITERPTLNILKLQEGETQVLDRCPKLQKASLGTTPAAPGVLVDSGMYFGNVLNTANMPGLEPNATISPFEGVLLQEVRINRKPIDLQKAVRGYIPEEWRKQLSKIRLDQPIKVNKKSRNTTLNDVTFQSFPVVSGLSDNHAREIVDMLSSVVAKMPQRGIILFDMGIRNKSKFFLQSHCNVTVRSIRRDIFADMVANLHDYRWKALLIYSTFLEFDGAIWADSSIRFKDSLDHLQLVRDGVGFIPMEVKHYSPAGAFTHDGMLEAFGVSRKSVAMSPMTMGGSSIWFKQGGDVPSTVLKH
eukprot:scpid58293/ scgid15881/ 